MRARRVMRDAAALERPERGAVAPSRRSDPLIHPLSNPNPHQTKRNEPGVKTDIPTPNLPVVDRLVGGVKQLTKSVTPKCPPNTMLDLAALRTMQSPCKPCPAGQISKEGDTTGKCGVCGKGRCAHCVCWGEAI